MRDAPQATIHGRSKQLLRSYSSVPASACCAAQAAPTQASTLGESAHTQLCPNMNYSARGLETEAQEHVSLASGEARRTQPGRIGKAGAPVSKP